MPKIQILVITFCFACNLLAQYCYPNIVNCYLGTLPSKKIHPNHSQLSD